jgi:hypothetical protein
LLTKKVSMIVPADSSQADQESTTRERWSHGMLASFGRT